MTPNEQIRKAREMLNTMADTFRDMAEDLEDLSNNLAAIGMENIKGLEPIQGFTPACELMRSGKRLPLGWIIHTPLKDGRVAKWRVIDNAGEFFPDNPSAVVQLAEILDYRPFSKADKKHPWGWNNYEASELAAWLENDFFQSLADNDRACVQPRTDLGSEKLHLWLLSEDEAGFGNLADAFDLYACEEQDEQEERRQLKDSDGDAAFWWLRTPYSGIAVIVRYVSTDGSLYGYYALNAIGVAPACYIG